MLRVRLIMNGPGLPRGVRIREPVQLIDVAPTILEVAGVHTPDSFEGRGLLELATGRRAEQLEGKELYTVSTQPPRQAVLLHGHWKCIVERDAALAGGQVAVELYNLRDDPGETRDLARVEPERAAELRARLLARVRATASGARATRQTLSADDESGLRELGYIE